MPVYPPRRGYSIDDKYGMLPDIKSKDETIQRSRQFFKSCFRIPSLFGYNCFYPNSFMQLLSALSLSLFIRESHYPLFKATRYWLNRCPVQKIFPKGERGGLSVARPIYQFGSIPLSSRVFTKDKSYLTPLAMVL